MNLNLIIQWFNNNLGVVVFVSGLSFMIMGIAVWVRGLYREIAKRGLEEEELRSAYEQLKQTQSQLIQSEKVAATGQLAVGAAHEINNPLFVISGEAEILLRDENKDQGTRDASRIILEQTKKIATITKSLLEFSRQIEPKREPLDVNKVIEDSISLLSYQTKMDKINIVKELSADIPEVRGDKNQLQEVFLNIMLNAMQAMKEGGMLTVRTNSEKITENGRRKTDRFKLGERIMTIEFRDTGKGMDDQTTSKIFNPFFTRREKGTGLGLFVCYAIIDNHGGLSEAHSKLEEGSTFIFKLPIIEEKRQ